MSQIKIRRALISVFHKEGIENIAKKLIGLGVEIISTGGTYNFLESKGIPVKTVEEVTGYPSIFDGRVKTLHPGIFGGILLKRDNKEHLEEAAKYGTSQIDLIVVDLYPFEEWVASEAPDEEIIEKIDIGGISLIRAAAKNFKDVLVIPSIKYYGDLIDILENGGTSSFEQRANLAVSAFEISSGYDFSIYKYLAQKSVLKSLPLRYGENPHQKAYYYGNAGSLPEKLWGKDISYNNLLDVEAAIELISEFKKCTVAILKHNNACGCASGETLSAAWEAALASDPLSAFGGIIISNREIDRETAESMNKIFFEVIIAPSYSEEAFKVLSEKKNRIILINNYNLATNKKFRSLLGGVLVQDRDSVVEEEVPLTVKTKTAPSENQARDLVFANKVVKHSKSNAIVLVKDEIMIASGVGQTSRVDALKQAVAKAQYFGFPLEGAVMASDAFFPFSDSIEIAAEAGIKAIIQPGGSIRDNESIDYCNSHGIAMVFTGIRHFKH